MVIATTVVMDPSLVGHKQQSESGEVILSSAAGREVRAQAGVARASAAAGDPIALAHEVPSWGETIRTGSVTRNADSSSVGEDTSLDLSRGSTPKNEQGALAVAHAYGGRIASDGGKCWPMPFRVVATTEDPTIDVVAEECDTNGRVIARLAMQVVRPLSSDSWRELSQAITVEASAADVAESVVAAIRAKLRKYPTATDRSSLVLLIDATTALNATLQVVIDAFSMLHAAEAAAAGFREIWLVGPTEALIHQLA